MAIPTTLFTNNSGIALMRLTGSEWFFVRWIEPGVDVHVSNPGPGSHVYQIWTVLASGDGASGIDGTGALMSIHALEVSK